MSLFKFALFTALVSAGSYLIYRKNKKELEKCKYCGKNCNTNGIDVKYCPEFQPFKNATIKLNYFGFIDNAERLGYCAAGLYASYNDMLLFVREERNGKNLLNFIGGKRESKEETPDKTAIREFIEETSDKHDNPLIEYSHDRKCYILKSTHEITPIIYKHKSLWIAQSKYVLFSAKVNKNFYNESILLNYNHNSKMELVWVNIKEITEMMKNDKLEEYFHGFAIVMLKLIQNAGVDGLLKFSIENSNS